VKKKIRHSSFADRALCDEIMMFYVSPINHGINEGFIPWFMGLSLPVSVARDITAAQLIFAASVCTF
jgi:hypothetical protein